LSLVPFLLGMLSFSWCPSSSSQSLMQCLLQRKMKLVEDDTSFLFW
jgi:hypothetical protein